MKYYICKDDNYCKILKYELDMDYQLRQITDYGIIAMSDDYYFLDEKEVLVPEPLRKDVRRMVSSKKIMEAIRQRDLTIYKEIQKRFEKEYE